MLTRWAVQPMSTISALSVKSVMYAPVNPGLDPKLDWPSCDEIIASQESSREKPLAGFNKTDAGWCDEKDRIWIPSDDELLKLRILIAAHTGIGGHRGQRVTRAAVEGHFLWTKMKKDVHSFVGSCLHCLATAPGTTVPRPLGHALHAVKPNKLIHFDFCYMSPGQDGNKYVFVIKDDFSGYVLLKATTETTAEVTASHLIDWFAAVGVVKQWVSDRGTHFKNELVRSLRDKLKTQHHFTLAYCPWSNGTVEVVNRELLRATRALLSEYQLPEKNWPSVLPVVQSVLNNTILEGLDNTCPLTALTGLPHDTPLLSIKRKKNKAVEEKTIDQVRGEQRINAKMLHATMEKMHKAISERVDAKRKAAVDAHNRKTNVHHVNFTEGDFVLRGARASQRGPKPQLKWHGPFQVVKVHSDFIFTIKNIVSGQTEEAHGRRLKFFRNSDYEVTEALRDHLAHQEGDLLVIEEFLGIRRRRGTVEIKVKWKGFDATETDWVDVTLLKEDVPVLLRDYVEDMKANGTTNKRKLVASI